MRKNIASVIDAWNSEETHREKTCRTDGTTIWSYELPIATRTPKGNIELLIRDYGKKPNGDVSTVTRSQIDAIAASMKKELLVMVSEVNPR